MIFLFVILSLVVSPTIVYGNAEDNPQQAIFNGLSNVVNKYSDQLDKSINWTQVVKNVKDLHGSNDLYMTSSRNSVVMLLLEIYVNTINARTNYMDAGRQLVNWCTNSKPHIELYLQSFTIRATSDIIETTQKDLLNKILDNGLTKMKTGVHKLEEAKNFLSKASGTLTTLSITLENDANHTIQQMEYAIREHRAQSYSLLAVNPLLGAIRLIVTEVDTVPQLNAVIETNKKYLQSFTNQTDGAIQSIEVSRNLMEDEITKIIKVHVSTEQTQTFMNLPLELIPFVTESAQKLLDQCNAFVSEHKI